MSEEKNMMAEANEETAQITQNERVIDLGKPYKFEGTEYTSIDLSGLDKLTVKDAIPVITKWLEEKGIGKAKVNYKLRVCKGHRREGGGAAHRVFQADAARGQPQGGRCRAQLHERGCRDGEPRDAA